MRIKTKDGRGEDVEGELEVEGNRAVIRLPSKTEQEMKDEQEVEVPMDDSVQDEMMPPLPPPPQSG